MDDLGSLRELIGLSLGDHAPAQVEGALRGAFGVELHSSYHSTAGSRVAPGYG